jgi:undecaprenyl-diphosphatase
VVEHRIGWLDPIFTALSRLGSAGIIWLVLAALAALLWRRPTLLVVTSVAVLCADLGAYALKRVIDRDRPPIRYPDPEPLVRVPLDHSFPSGHAATSFACAALISWWTPLPAAMLYGLAAAIAFSRVYVGVHYPLDILGGAVVGLGIATALRWLVAGRRQSPPAPPAG